MTRNELLRERWIEKQRAKIVKAEIARTKRAEQIKKHVNLVLEIMTAIVLALLMFLAFFIDAFGFMSVPTWVYVVGIGYLLFYMIFSYKIFTK